MKKQQTNIFGDVIKISQQKLRNFPIYLAQFVLAVQNRGLVASRRRFEALLELIADSRNTFK